MHALGWSREKALEFLESNSSLSHHNCTTEIDRYITWPGQATGYKVGEIKIKELRNWATKELGDKFDVRDFHDVILGVAPVPLSFLEATVRAWVEKVKAS